MKLDRTISVHSLFGLQLLNSLLVNTYIDEIASVIGIPLSIQIPHLLTTKQSNKENFFKKKPR